MDIDQAFINFLFEVRKKPISKATLEFPVHGTGICIDCHCEEGRYHFQTDINRRNRFNTKKASFQLRHNKTFVIRRLCLNNGIHENPPDIAPLDILRGYEGAEITTNHVHLFIPGYNDRWAIPLTRLPEINIEETDSLNIIFEKFLVYCNVESPSFKPTLHL